MAKSRPRSRGSEWRKWDLHLHSPGTKLNDQFRVDSGEPWDEYCLILHDSDVQVFGITDYFSADGYFNTVTEFRDRYPKSPKILFPNVELRTGDVVNPAQEEVNIHLIFNPFQPDYENKIKTFLQLLKTNKTESGGRHITASELSEKRHYEEATTTRQFIHDALRDTYGRNADLLDYLLIITAANNDGLRPERGKKRKLLITDELDKFSDGFLGNAGNVEYYLDRDRAEDEMTRTKPKPVLSGCDAHSFAQLNERLGQVVLAPDGVSYMPTWIKSDLTFEGLKQIIFEPQNRVYIGEEPEIEKRVREHSTKYIDKLNVTSVDGYQDQHGIWFKDEQIFFNKELVAIIGNKGSGKSAITDIVGLLGNSHNQTSDNPERNGEELFSFLNKEKFLKKRCAKNFNGQLIWYSGEPDCNLLDAKVDKNLQEKVEYLPQKYLERICTNIADDEFRATLNEVIFRYVERQQRYGQSNLDDLIGHLTQQADEDIQNSKNDLHRVNEKVVSIEKKLTEAYREKIEEKICLKEEELDAHREIRPAAKPKPTDESAASTVEAAKEIEGLTRKIADFHEQIEQLQEERVKENEIIEELRQMKQAIERKAGMLTTLQSQYQSTLQSVGLEFQDIVKLTLDYSKLDAVIDQKNQRLEEIYDLLVTEEDIVEEFDGEVEAETTRSMATSKSIVCQKMALEQKKEQLVERLSKPEREYQSYMKELARWTAREKEICGDDQNPEIDSLRGLKNELNKIQTVYPQDLQNAHAEQRRVSEEVFRKKRSLVCFYDTIKQSIDTQISKCRDDLSGYMISVEAGLRFDLSFIDKFLQFVNQGVRGSFYGREEGKVMLQEFCSVVDDWEDETEVFNVLEVIVDALHSDKRDNLPPAEDKERDVFNQMMNQDIPVVELYDYLGDYIHKCRSDRRIIFSTSASSYSAILPG